MKGHLVQMPDGLHPDTAKLVARFATAMAKKLHLAEKTHGYSNEWMQKDWMEDCRADLVEHLKKGDPRDVANYCAFLWRHKEHTAVYALQSVVITGRASDT